MNAPKVELEACPFCGGEAEVIARSFADSVICQECEASGPECRTGAEAIAAWNRRTDAAASVPLAPGDDAAREGG